VHITPISPSVQSFELNLLTFIEIETKEIPNSSLHRYAFTAVQIPLELHIMLTAR